MFLRFLSIARAWDIHLCFRDDLHRAFLGGCDFLSLSRTSTATSSRIVR